MSRLYHQLATLILRRPSTGEGATLELIATMTLWFYLFLLIVTLVMGRSVGSALFLCRFNGRGLALMYILVGLVVACLVACLEWLGKGTRTAVLPFITLFLFLVSMLGAGWVFPRLEGDHAYLYGLFYLLVESFAFVATVQFWTTANSAFSLDQARRLYVIVGTGGIFGSIVGGWLARILADGPIVNEVFVIAGIIPVVLGCMFLFDRLTIPLRRHAPKDADRWNLDHAAKVVGLAPTSPDSAQPSHARIHDPTMLAALSPREPRATLDMPLSVPFGLVSLLMVFSTTLVDYYYKMHADYRFADDVGQLTAFFGNFYLCVGVMTLLTQALVTPFLFRTGKTFLGLVGSPLALLAMTVFNVFQPGLFAAAFFKLTDSVLTHSVYRSCQEMLYTPLPTRWIRQLKSLADGVYGRYGLILSGVFLLLLTPSGGERRGNWLLPWLMIFLLAQARPFFGFGINTSCRENGSQESRRKGRPIPCRPCRKPPGDLWDDAPGFAGHYSREVPGRRASTATRVANPLRRASIPGQHLSERSQHEIDAMECSSPRHRLALGIAALNASSQPVPPSATAVKVVRAEDRDEFDANVDLWIKRRSQNLKACEEIWTAETKGTKLVAGSETPGGDWHADVQRISAIVPGQVEWASLRRARLGISPSPPSIVNWCRRCTTSRANVDWPSFAIRGEENLEFPQQLFDNEFRRVPLYYADPRRLLRRVTGNPPPASNVLNRQGDIANSSFFTNTDIASYTSERIEEEFRRHQPVPPMAITKVKEGGTSEGIWIKDANGRKHILIFDPPFCPEMTTSAEYIGSTLMRMAGYHVPKTCITTVEGTGNTMFDGRRAVATVALDNFKGGWRYDSFRDRREIRALIVFGGWINNVDQTEQNTGLTMDDDGVIRHYVLDFGACLGSFTFRPQPARLGWTKLFDPWAQFSQPLNDSGIRRVRWEAPYSVHSPAVGYFSDNYDPDRWQPFYANMGFLEVTHADRVWAARRIAQFSDEQILSVVRLAGYTQASDADHVARTLIRRRDILLERYLPGVKARSETPAGSHPSVSGAPRRMAPN
ncbi:MAG: Npt1/Npt2 family nucleotide transporter [Planctomycetota bacterium]